MVAILVSAFFFFFFCTSECLQCLCSSEVWRESAFCAISVKPWRLLWRQQSTIWSWVFFVICYELRANSTVASWHQDFSMPCSLCRLQEGKRGVHFSPLKLNVIQTTPLARTNAHIIHCHFCFRLLFFPPSPWNKTHEIPRFPAVKKIHCSGKKELDWREYNSGAFRLKFWTEVRFNVSRVEKP